MRIRGRKDVANRGDREICDVAVWMAQGRRQHTECSRESDRVAPDGAGRLHAHGNRAGAQQGWHPRGERRRERGQPRQRGAHRACCAGGLAFDEIQRLGRAVELGARAGHQAPHAQESELVLRIERRRESSVRSLDLESPVDNLVEFREVEGVEESVTGSNAQPQRKEVVGGEATAENAGGPERDERVDRRQEGIAIHAGHELIAEDQVPAVRALADPVEPLSTVYGRFAPRSPSTPKP